MKTVENSATTREELLKRHAELIESFIDWEGLAIGTLHSIFTPNRDLGQTHVIPRVTRNEVGRVISLASPRVIPLLAEETLNVNRTIPPQLRFLKSLLVLNLSQCCMQGTIPEEIGELQTLQNLHLAYNFLEGPIPESFAGLVNLRVLDLGNNRLSGRLDTAFLMISCVFMYLNNNHFSGELSASIGNMRRLQRLAIQENEITGELPETIVELPVIEMLQLSNNKLDGLTSSLTLPPSLRWMYLSHNKLQKGCITNRKSVLSNKCRSAIFPVEETARGE